MSTFGFTVETDLSACSQDIRDVPQASLQLEDMSIGSPSCSPAKVSSVKLQRALQIKDRCDRDLQALCESKRGRQRPSAINDGHGELILLEQEKVNESTIRDKRELERLLRKLSPAVSNSAITHAEFVHLLQACSVCNNRLAFCAACTEKAAEFFSGYTSTELFLLYGGDLPSANDAEFARFAETIAARETRATFTAADLLS